ncbi:guanylate kinase [Helicobacter muridarum]|uniref:Guanylate kinase n=1 Tax=Helicobacter muridarum TaxID=216 RepID=A0A377PTH6_9HELI|nr:guanylate kinase [Helicobacter muridarum]TLD99267.1 guanylate kinase [Helicobacter muridarum]STQ86146.1 guanylate kinase [Helicobacter muridarum]
MLDSILNEKAHYCSNLPYNIMIISGPSGAGKSTLTNFLRYYISNIYFSISTTTRSMREGELHGREYFFVSKEDFYRDIELGNFLEYEQVHDNFYGTGLCQFQEGILNNRFIVCDVDVRGHNSIKKFYPNAKSVFITTKDLATLESRLLKRQTDSKHIIQKRIRNALDELKYADAFDYLLINDNIEDSKEAILHIAKSIILLNHASKMQDLLMKYGV